MMTSKPVSTTKTKSRRPLTLHVSALSDAEYTAYTNWLGEIVGPLNRKMKNNGGAFGNDNPTQSDEKAAAGTGSGDSDWDPEGTLVSVREARGWIRGRWGNGPHALDGVVIDSILKKFSPDLAAQDVLTGGQFFAVMRMVCHSQGQVQLPSGNVDESLVFVQANPNYNSDSPKRSHKKEGSASASDVYFPVKKGKAPPPPIPLSRQSGETPPSQAQPIMIPDYSSKQSSSSNAPALPPRVPPPNPSPNPFIRPSWATSDGASVPNAAVTETSRNPFRPSEPFSSTHSSTSASTSASASASASDDSSSRKHQIPLSAVVPSGSLPPLPPRKPAILPPPRHASIRPTLTSSHSSSTASTTTYVPPPLPPPAPPPKPPKMASPLIKQSLEAARGAQSLKASLDHLSRERQLEVIKKSTSGGGPSPSVAEAFSTRDADYKRLTARSMSPPRSIYNVATAQIAATPPRSALVSASPSTSASSSVSSSGVSIGGIRPKLHADTTLPIFSASASRTFVNRNLPSTSPFSSSLFSPGGGGNNPRRTKSLHHPSPSTATANSESTFPFDKPNTNANQPPPPPRRRPESIQVFRTVNEINSNSNNPFTLQQRETLAQDWPPPKLASSNIIPSSRRISTSTIATHLSEPTTTSSHNNPSSTSSAGTAVLDTLQRTFSTLKPGPGFESARIRAEGRILPSGFSKISGKGAERLMDDVDTDENDDKERRRTDEVTKDDTGLSSFSGFSQDSAMDNYKIPMRSDEGWMSLN